jgi:hypothetical protein
MKSDTQHNGTQCSVSMLSVIYVECRKQAHYAECHYAECHYAECHYAECHYAECRGAVLIAGPKVINLFIAVIYESS